VLDKNSIVDAESTVKVVVTGKGNYAGDTLEQTYRITKSDFSKAKIIVNAQIYTGKPITLNKASFSKVSVQGVDVTGNFDTDYEIVEGSYKDNINKGTASVTIRGKGNYGGSKVVKFKINSKGFLWWWRK
jgi:myo-inositol-1-phosphate synthase